MQTTAGHYESFMAALNQYNDVVNANRIELNPPEADEFTGTADMTATGDLSSVAAATATAKSTGGDDLNLDLITK